MMSKAFLISDMFGDLFPAAERSYLHDSERLLAAAGFHVDTVFLNRAAALRPGAWSDRSELQQQLHSLYLAGGLAVATQQLAALLARETEPCIVIAFSMGGFAAWSAAGNLRPASRALFLGATRLRLATSPVDGVRCSAVFGNEDAHAPDAGHLHRLNMDVQYVRGGHEFYKDAGLGERVICPWLAAGAASSQMPPR